MTPQEEYAHLLSTLPKDLTPDELARFKTAGYPFPSTRQMLVVSKAVCRGGEWYPVLIFIHPFGVVGHHVLPQARQFKADAVEIADKFVETIMDVHQQQTGVRHRGLVEDEDEDGSEPCPPVN